MSSDPPPVPASPPPMPLPPEPKRGFPVIGWIAILVLVPILVISLLAALAVPTVNRVRKKAAVVQARNTIVSLETALDHYQAEYGRLPDVRNPRLPDDSVVDTGSAEGAALVSILMGADLNPGDNPKQIVFFSPPPQANKRRGGLVPAGSGHPKLHDPWGRGYKVALDQDGDQVLVLPVESGAASGLKGHVAAVYSLGAEGAGGSQSIVSW